MKIQELPFLHYMVRSGTGRESHLLSPIEAEYSASGGTFVAPLQADGVLYPSYRFQFSIYLGAGNFVEVRGKKALLDGVAATVKRQRQDHLLLTFELPGPEPWWPYDLWHGLPRFLRQEDEFYLPTFRRIPRRSPLKYGGRFVHEDFQQLFVQLEPTEPKILDEILERFLISIVGCDPHTKYRKLS